MSLMDVVVHASIKSEPFGMVLIEAMAIGKPTVAAKEGGPDDIVVNGMTGYLYKAGDIEKMSDLIVKLLSNETLKKKIGSNGRKRVEKMFSNIKSAETVDQIYNTLLGKDYNSLAKLKEIVAE